MRTISNRNIKRDSLLTLLLESWDRSSIAIVIGLFLINIGTAFGQAPDWEYSGDFGTSMTIIFTVSDECVPSDDPNDIIGAFDINGQVRGVAKTNIGNEAYVVIGGNTNGEKIYFKVYDAGTDSIYNIHSYITSFTSGARLGPLVLNFDSNPTSTSGGPDQWVVDATSTNLAASGVGVWSQLPGVQGIIADPADPNSVFTGVIGTAYSLTWTLNNTEGCIGETDEVSVTFAFAQSEDTPERCADGIDNDGNGLTDCQESACGKPILGGITITAPTPTSCSTAAADGVIVISHTNANSFSIDNGATFQSSNSFSALPVGEYQIVIKNDIAECTDAGSASLINTLSVAPPVPSFDIDGASVICKGTDAVSYSITKPLNGQVVWSYTGTDASVVEGGINSTIDFGTNATAGMLTAVMSNACSSNSATMEIGIANTFLCSAFTNCLPVVTVSNSLLENANIARVFRASDQLNSNAQLANHNYEFSAGNSVQFQKGFSVDQGLSFIANIRNCTN